MYTQIQDEIKYVTKGILPFDVAVLVILLLTSNLDKAMVLGLVFGTIIGVLNFRLLAITIAKSVTMAPSKAQLYTGSRYMLRMTIIVVVLFVSATARHLDLIGVAIGLLSPKFVILIRKLLVDKLIDKLKRKEA